MCSAVNFNIQQNCQMYISKLYKMDLLMCEQLHACLSRPRGMLYIGYVDNRSQPYWKQRIKIPEWYAVWFQMFLIKTFCYCKCFQHMFSTQLLFRDYKLQINMHYLVTANSGLISGLHPASERRRYKVKAVYHWLGANLESALQIV